MFMLIFPPIIAPGKLFPCSLSMSDWKRKSPSWCWGLKSVGTAMVFYCWQIKSSWFTKCLVGSFHKDNILITDERCWKHDVKFLVATAHVVKHWAPVCARQITRPDRAGPARAVRDYSQLLSIIPGQSDGFFKTKFFPIPWNIDWHSSYFLGTYFI